MCHPLRPALLRVVLGLLLPARLACAADIGVTPVAVHLDQLNDRATMSVVNSGAEPVIMQVEAISWRSNGGVEDDLPTSDMIVNPSIFTVPPGQAQLVRIGLRRALPAQREGTYRLVLREVPAAPRAGELRVSGQVRVLMALRVPIYVAPQTVVRELRWQATQAKDGSVTATLRNEGNVHVRVARAQFRSAAGELLDAGQVMGSVVLSGEARSYRLRGATPTGERPMTLEVTTDHGVESVPIVLAGR